MITWLQTRFQKHHKWLFAVMLVVIIFAFVFAIGNQSFHSLVPDHNKVRTKDFYGYNLASQSTDDYLDRAAQISAMVSPELVQQMGYGFNMDDYSMMRAAALGLARSIGIAEPDKQMLAEYARTKPVFFDQDGKFSAKQYKNVIAALAVRMRVAEAAVISILEDDFRIEKVCELLGGAGFINPEIIAVDRQTSKTKWTFSSASISFDDFKPEINPDEKTLEAYYNDNQARFEIPEKIQLTQIRFPTTLYAAQIPSPTDEQVNAYFERNKMRFAPAPVQKEDGTYENSEPVLDEVTRQRVVQEILFATAVQLSARSADEYTVSLWREEVPADSPKVLELARSMGATVSQMEPYSKDKLPRATGLNARQLTQLWDLKTSERYFSDVMTGADCASVMIYNGTIPARMPEFSEVKTEVAEAYYESRRSELFVEHCKDLRSKMDAALKAAQSFEQAAKGLGLEVEHNVNVTFEDATAELLRSGSALDVVSRMNKGELSQPRINPEGAFIAYVEDKDVPELSGVAPTEEELSITRLSVAATDGWNVLSALVKKRQAELDEEMSASYADDDKGEDDNAADSE